MRNDKANDRRARVPVKLDVHFDVCCGCGTEMPFDPVPGQARVVRIWCDSCVPHDSGVEEEGTFDGDVCPLCRVATENLHPEDGLCPDCERCWVKYGVLSLTTL